MTVPFPGVAAAAAGIVAILIAGCTGQDETPRGPEADAALLLGSPREALSRVETDLKEAAGRRLDFEVRAEGAFAASLEGSLVLAADAALALDASGTFGADSVSLWLDATEDPMSWGHGDLRSEADRPDGLRDALVIGLVRMGILHNLARLVSGAPPDRMDGDVRSWVEVNDPTWAGGGPTAEPSGIAFGILVGGEPAGEATLWFDADGVLVGREQLVRFPGGEMRVQETYRWTDGAPRGAP